MKNKQSILQEILRAVSYVLVATLASVFTYFSIPARPAAPTSQTPQTTNSKLDEIKWYIDNLYVGDYTEQALYDGAAAGMVSGTGDQWSYYIPASEYAAYEEQMQNAYVGIGVTITIPEDGEGLLVQKVEPTGGAAEAGIQVGDVIIQVEDQDAKALGADGAAILIKGAEGSQISVVVMRGEEKLTFQVTRKLVQVQVAFGKLLEGNVGLVTIANFDDRCFEETIAVIESLKEQGAEALIFDVRFNPGGYRHELEKVLDYLLPEGVIFHAVAYNGEEDKTMSDAACLEMPMAVLINEDSYSAAELFATAMQEYEWAKVVGTPTTGKGYFQSTYKLSDGSAINLSVGKYYTPVKGLSLAETGGLVPDLIQEVDDETYYKIYNSQLDPAEDPQIQAALELLKQK